MKEIKVEFVNTVSFVANVRHELAKRIFAAASHLQTKLKGKLSTPYPPASVAGEYPRARTFTGRNAVTVYPSDLGTISRTLRTYVGYTVNAEYMATLEETKQRLGLLYCYQQMRAELSLILGGRGYVKQGWD